MDPDETLTELREWAETVLTEGSPGFRETQAAEQFAALDQWITRGGFVPRAWEPNASNA